MLVAMKIRIFYNAVSCINDFLLGKYTWTFMHSVEA